MIGGPAPGFASDPGPAVEIDPGPASALIRSPAGSYLRDPDVAVGTVVGPAAVGVQIFGAGDIAADVSGTAGVFKEMVAGGGPAIKFVFGDSADHLKFGIGGGAAGLHGLAGWQFFGAAGAGNLRVAAGADGDLTRSIRLHRDAINSLP